MLIDLPTQRRLRRDDWIPDFGRSGQPRYVAIADAIASDLAAGRLRSGDRLPPQRALAERLGIDFTTVARGYTEARNRGLLEAVVGRGSFVRTPPPSRTASPERYRTVADFSMNLPPEPQDAELLARMQAGLESTGRDLLSNLRYQAFGGSDADKAAATSWLGRRALVPSHDRLFVVPGAHAAMHAVLAAVARPGDVIVSEVLTYPGIRGIAAQLGLTVVGVAEDADGIDPVALDEAIRRLKPKLLYLNPGLRNPTTHTIPITRRVELAEVARRHSLQILEDDAYGFIPVRGPSPFAALVPDLTWHVAGLSKCIGAGLRIAYVIAPDARSALPFINNARIMSVMASPLTAAFATRWIEDGTADAILGYIRAESGKRQKLATTILPAGSYEANPIGFHLWLKLPEQWSRSAFLGHMRSRTIGVVASDAFTVSGVAPEAVRVCLGGPADLDGIRAGLEDVAHALMEHPMLASTYL